MAVEAMRRVLAMAPAHTLAWTAGDGVEAVEKCARDRPDLILMDLMMPRMNGVEATRRIMAQSPCAILVVTADIESHAAHVFAAMGEGALDAVDTPLLVSDAGRGTRPLLSKIETIARLIAEDRRQPRMGAGLWWRWALRRAGRGLWPPCLAVCRVIFPPPWLLSSMWMRVSPPAWSTGWAITAPCRCVWPQRASASCPDRFWSRARMIIWCSRAPTGWAIRPILRIMPIAPRSM
jgi:chemotaxis response regulator CheB